jgi:hypothetical protein
LGKEKERRGSFFPCKNEKWIKKKKEKKGKENNK